MDSNGTFRFVDDVLLAHKNVHQDGLRGWTLHLTGHCPRLDTSFNLNVMSIFLFDIDHFQAVRFVANVRLFTGPNLEGPF